jgi:hypothetical protein
MKQQKRGRIEPYKRMKMAENHSWEAPDGYKIMVIDRGAVSFNFPENWIVAKLEPHLELHDAEPPDDEARLSVSFWRTPPGIDWTDLPLAPLLAKASEGSKLEILARSEIIRFPRADLEIVWTEHRFMDPVEKREAYSRIAMARGWDVHVLITFDFWVSDAEKLAPMWDEALRSLQLGRTIADPSKGVIKH